MRRIFGGAVLVIAGIAAFIEAHGRAPAYVYRCVPEPCPVETRVGALLHTVSELESGHLAQTPYDLLRIGAWALLIVGGLLVIVGLIGYWARLRCPS